MGRAPLRERPTSAPASRLLTPAEAASYCRLSRTLFDHECDVRPIVFGGNAVKRYDRLDLDAWIDRRKGAPDDRPFDEWLEALDRGDARAG